MTQDDVARPDPAELADRIEAVGSLAEHVAARWKAAGGTGGPPDLGAAFLELTTKSFADPSTVNAAQLELWANFLRVWENATRRQADPSIEPIAKPEPGDRRFRDEDWDRNPVFDAVKQQYLLASNWVEEQMRELASSDPATAQRVAFYTRQFVQALAPTNFLLTNPEALRATLESSGENLVRGLGNLLRDLDRGGGEHLRITTTDLEAFELGRDLAITPGKVVYQDELMQLLQYEPSTEQVYRRPLLIVPPWINKYYVLDLRPENSFIRWAVERGYTVFVVSWVNPDERHAGKNFEHYMLEGPLAALNAIEQATGEREVNAVGYCIGGTLLASTLGHMAAKEDTRIASATLLAAQLDFSEPGELAVFADEPQIEALERRMAANGGLLDADAMATTFNLLRANDLIWSYVISNYLLGRDPAPFDLLFWNSDATRMPAPMQSYYLRNMYLRNALVQAGALELGGTPIDLGRVKIPMYVQSAREDHISPYTSVFRGMQMLGGSVRFVLAGSGHIAGVVNPPSAMKYGHVINEHASSGVSLDEWLAGAEEHAGSWWPDWDRWLAPQSGEMVAARRPGDGALGVIEDAPGSYVRVRS